MKKKTKTQRKGTALMCYLTDDVASALRIITANAGGNKTKAVSQAILDAAERMHLTASLAEMDKKEGNNAKA